MWQYFLFFLIILSVHGQSCHPQCHWACDDPVCNATCVEQCSPPACQIINATNLVCASVVPDCSIVCAPTPHCEALDCPACEVQCQPPPTLCGDGTILCEAPNCAWQCSKPDCRLPLCELQCESPTCGVMAGAGQITVSFLFLALVVLVIV